MMGLYYWYSDDVVLVTDEPLETNPLLDIIELFMEFIMEHYIQTTF